MRRRSTPRLLVAIATSFVGLALAVLGGIPEAALLAAPWFVLSVLGLMQRGAFRVPTVQVHADQDRVVVGDPLVLRTSLSMDATGLLRVTSDPGEGFMPALDASGEPAVVGSTHATGPDEPVMIETELIASRWGTHSLGRTEIQVTEPFGLFVSHGQVAAQYQVRVHPTSVQLRELITPWMVRRISGSHPSRASARGVEFADIRPFGTGDSVRDINWRASARSTGLLVSDRHPDRATDVVLLVDSFVESGHDLQQVFGMAIEAALALSESHLSATDRVGLIEFGGLISWISPGVGQRQLHRLTDSLLATGLFANAADKDLPILPPKALPPRSFIVALTPLLDDRFIDAVFEARSRGHDVAVIECVAFDGDESALDTGESAAGEPGPTLRQVSIQLWQAERRLIRDRMAEQGIAVAAWRREDHLDVVINELIRRRQRGARMAHR